jgi:novobiocin biosynthesis protein NovU/D-mycarose 3-C-methyltransferase
VCRGEPDYFVPSEAEAWLWDRDAYTTTQARVDHVRDDILAAIRGLQGSRLAGYAASAKSTTLLNYCGLESSRVKYVVDTTPHKIGRVTPGTGIPVVAPGDRPEPDVYLLLSWNYLPGVLRRERQFIDGGGRFLVPIPTPVIL